MGWTSGTTKRWAIWGLALSSLIVVSCESKRSPSILVVAVDSLPFNPSVCSRESSARRSGLRQLCAESIRFTHAMTTSTLSLPALTSLMTAAYPFQHGVRVNGRPGLRSEPLTLAELAVRRGYRTAFFSGGPPAFRRSGLHQGFEVFDDFLNPSSGRLFRPFSENSSLFSSWLDNEVGGRPFLSVLYVPDLNFTDTPTESEMGELRAFTYESQLDEFDESLSRLISDLKESRRWNDTLVVLVGLNGREVAQRPGALEPFLLNGENTQVTLLIKPAAKPRDQGMSWKIDRNVSLADVGKTLFAFLDGTVPFPASEDFPVYDLSSIFRSAEPEWPDARPILIESAWAAWHGWGGIRAAVVDQNDLVILDEKPLYYNTLTDQFEQNPGRPAALPSNARRLLDLLAKNGFSSFRSVDEGHLHLLRSPALDWLLHSRSGSWSQRTQAVSKRSDADRRTLLWAAQAAIDNKDWAHLEWLANQTGDLNWKAVALRNMGRNALFSDPCLALLDERKPSTDDIRGCPEELFVTFLRWARSDLQKDERERARRQFLRLWELHQLQLRVLKANAGLGMIWFSATDEPVIPSRTSLALALPGSKKPNQ